MHVNNICHIPSKCYHFTLKNGKHSQSNYTLIYFDYPGEPAPKGKTNLDLLEQEIVSGISWAICKSAPRPRQITTPSRHHSVFYGPDALPAAQPTVLKH